MPTLTSIASHEEIFEAIERHGIWIPDVSPIGQTHADTIRALDFRQDQNTFPGEDLAEILMDEGAWEAVRIPAKDFVALLNDPQLKDGRLATGLVIGGLCIEGNIELQKADIEIPIRLVAGRIEGNAYFDFAKLASLDFQSIIARQINARGAEIVGDVSFVSGRSDGGLSFDDTKIKGRLKVSRSCLFKYDENDVVSRRIVLQRHRGAIALSLRGAEVSDGVLMEVLSVSGAIIIDNADIQSSLVLDEVNVEAMIYPERTDGTSHRLAQGRGYAFKALATKVSESVDIRNSSFAGEVRMLSLETSGSIYFQAVNVKGANGRSLLMDFAKINGDVRFTGCSFLGCMRMRKAHIRGDLIFGRERNLEGTMIQFNIVTQFDDEEAPFTVDAYDRIKGFALRLSGAVIEGDFRIMGETNDPARIIGTIDLNNVSIGRKFRLQGCRIWRRLQAYALSGQFMSVAGDIRWAGVNLLGVADLQDAQVVGSFEIVPFVSAEFDGIAGFSANGDGHEALLMRRIKVGGDFRVEGFDKEENGEDIPFRIIGPTILTAAEIGGELILAKGACRVGRQTLIEPDPRINRDMEDETPDGISDHSGVAVGLRAAKIERGVFIERNFSSLGEFRLVDAKVNGDVRFAQAEFRLSQNHIGRHRHAIRMDRMEINGSLSLGGKGGERDAGYFESISADAERSVMTPLEAPRLIIEGTLRMSGLRVNGYMSIESVWIKSLSTLAGQMSGEAQREARFHISAIESELINVGKGLYFSNRENHAVVCQGNVTFSGSEIGDVVSLKNTYIIDPSEKGLKNKGAFVAEHMTVGSNFDIENGVFIGGFVLTQIHVSGTSHILRTVFASSDIAFGTEDVWRAGGLDLTDTDFGEVGLSALRGTFGRSLKLRETVNLFGVLNLTAARIDNDLELWLRDLQAPDALEETLTEALLPWSHLEGFEAPSLRLPSEINHSSMLWAQRMKVAGTFHLGQSADPDDIDETDTENVVPKTIDSDCGGVLDLTDSEVNTIRDTKASWPCPGNLILNGFTYERFDDASTSVPKSAVDRIEWIERCRRPTGRFEQSTFSPDLLFDQLFLVYRKMGLAQQAQTVNYTKIRYQIFRNALNIFPWRTYSQYSETSPPIWLSVPWSILSVLLSLLFWPLRAISWAVYGWGTYCGYRPWRFIGVVLPWFFVGLVIANSAYYPVGAAPDRDVPVRGIPYEAHTSCMLPASEGYYYNFIARTRVEIEKEAADNKTKPIPQIRPNEYLTIGGYPQPNIPLYTLDSLIPLDLRVDKYWRMSDESDTCVPAKLHLDGLIPGFTKEDYLPLNPFGYDVSFRLIHVWFVLIGYVLVGVLIAAASGLASVLIRPNVRDPG